MKAVVRVGPGPISQACDVRLTEHEVSQRTRGRADPDSPHGDVLKRPRGQTVIADGRNFLLTTSQSYDVIISEPSNPWIGGLASLLSVEFFQLARQRLRPGGIMVQWLQGHSLHPDDLRMIVKTFRTVFPASIWNPLPRDFPLVGRAEPAPLDLEQIEARYRRSLDVAADLHIGKEARGLDDGRLDLGDVQALDRMLGDGARGDPAADPITRIDLGSGWRSIGMCPDSSWVGMSTVVLASVVPLPSRKK